MTRNLFFCEEWAVSFLDGHKGKINKFPQSVRSTFAKLFAHIFPSSLGKDLTVKNANFLFFFHLGFMS
jgi:hypothetical protein